jgi:hypothetical protein
VAAVVLFTLNIPLIRLYEGYPWQKSLVGRWRASRQRKRADLLEQTRERARLLTRQAREAGVRDHLPREFDLLLNSAGQQRSSFPVKTSSILPTRLGNVIRAFEGYPKLKYGIDAIMLWPRLAQKLPKETAETLDAAKMSFDFMLNCSVLAAVAALAEAVTGIIRQHPLHSSGAGPWLVATAIFLVLAYLFYLGAINRAASWGTEVKVAFDLFRLDLLSSLGYKTEISGPAEERALWDEISYQFLYPDAPNLAELPYETGQTRVWVTPLSVVVTASRSVSWDAKEFWVVSIEVNNEDKFRHDADAVEITEKIPEGFRVVENSIEISGRKATAVRSLDPLIVGIGGLPRNDTKMLTYKLQKT